MGYGVGIAGKFLMGRLQRVSGFVVRLENLTFDEGGWDSHSQHGGYVAGELLSYLVGNLGIP